MKDSIQRFHFEQAAVRGEVARIEASLAAVLEKHDYPVRIQGLLGEFMTAAALLSATLKFEGSLILQARGDGPLAILMAECNHHGELRAIAQLGDDWGAHSEVLPLPELFGNAQLAITIEPDDGERYQGIVPLDGHSLARCIEHYFAQSEQLPTRLWLAAGGGRAGGLLLQVLPGHDQDDGEDPDAWPRLQQLADTVRHEELVALPAEELLHRLYHEEEVRLLAEQFLRFHCSCSRGRTEQALISLGAPELQSLLEEQGGIHVSCQFCNQEYDFDAVDVAQLIHGGGAAPGRLH